MRDDLAALQRVVDPDTGTRRGQRTIDGGAGLREEAAEGVLGVDPRLDRVAVEADVVLGERQRLAGGDPELQLDQVDAGDQPR